MLRVFLCFCCHVHIITHVLRELPARFVWGDLKHIYLPDPQSCWLPLGCLTGPRSLLIPGLLWPKYQ